VTDLIGRAMGRLASATMLKPAIRLDQGPMCSFTFDDCPRSALDNAGAALESHGLSGTFFVGAGVSGEDVDPLDPLMVGDDFVRARAAGHEIGCHTFSHPHMPLLKRSEMESEFQRNWDEVRKADPDLQMTSFAYPFGEVSFSAKRAASAWFSVARGVRPGLNRRIVDLSELRSYSLCDQTFDQAELGTLVREAARKRAWLVFTCHDVREDPSEWGCTPEQFEFVLNEVLRSGVPVLTLKAALGRMTHRSGIV